MIVEIRNYGGELAPSNYLRGSLQTDEVCIADVEFWYSHCYMCDTKYNYRLVIREKRPLLPSDNSRYYPILVVTYSEESPRGAFGERALHKLGEACNHYYNQNDGIRLFLLQPYSKVTKLITRRYVNHELWDVPELLWRHESSMTTCLILEDGGLIPIEFEQKDTAHKRCRDSNLIIGCTTVYIQPDGFIAHSINNGNKVKWGESFYAPQLDNLSCQQKRQLKEGLGKYNLTLTKDTDRGEEGYYIANR